MEDLRALEEIQPHFKFKHLELSREFEKTFSSVCPNPEFVLDCGWIFLSNGLQRRQQIP